jgi:CheY-like chemotaxis protein
MTATPEPVHPVLIVDDDADVRDAMEYLLRSEGYSTATAADGDEALTKLRAGLEPCLILLDLMMPWKDGFQFRREQLRDPRLSTIPVVVLSGRHQPEIDAPLLNAAAYLQKPVDPETLLPLIAQHRSRS